MKIAPLTGLLLLGLSLSLQAETLKIDPVHSTIGFKIRHLFGYVTGRFNDVKGAIDLDMDHPENASVQATIGVESIDTANAKRDSDLKSPQFFDAAQFAQMSFASTKVERKGKDEADVTGNLTLHGVTKPIVLHVKFLGEGPGMMGGKTTGWEATAELKRSDYGLTWSKTVETTQLVGDDVAIDLSITADAPK